MSDAQFFILVGGGFLIFSQILMFGFWLSGWRKLARGSGDVKFNGILISNISGRVGWVGYGSLLVVSFSSAGISFGLPSFVSLWHKPFSVSWEALTRIRFGRRLLMARLIMEFEAEKTKVRLEIPRRYVDEIVGVMPRNVTESVKWQAILNSKG